jgi:MoaA/NifB/PqqE/SkfB family radical SAM enzyme
MVSNMYLMNEHTVDALNQAGLTDIQVSIDGVEPNKVTVKVLKPLRKKLEMLSSRARFRVNLTAVIGAAPPEEVWEVVRFARDQGFRPRVLLIHDDNGVLQLSDENKALFKELQEVLGWRSYEAFNYRNKLIQGEPAPFKCRAGCRYLYVDEFGKAHRCSQTMDRFSRDLMTYSLADLKEQFYSYKECNAYCTLGCARTNSKFDQWRAQNNK